MQRVGAATVAAVLACGVLAACARESEVPIGAPSTTVGQESGATAPESEATSWDAEGLLPLAGGVTRVDDIGIYFADDDGTYTVVAIEVASGHELWRQAVNQHRRIPGVVETPTVDADSGLVFATQFDTSRQTPLLTAFDLWSGEVVWTADLPDLARSTPMLCGDHSVCLPTVQSGYLVHRRADGEAVEGTQGGFERFLGARGDIVVTADGDAQQVEMGRLGDDGYSTVWSASFSDVFGPDLGPRYSPDGGWSVLLFPETSSSVLAFGPAMGAGDPESWGDEEWRAYVEAGWVVAVVGGAGTPVRVVAPAGPCWASYTDLTGFEICDVAGVRERPRPVGEDELPFEPMIGRVARYGADGVELWSTPFEEPMPAWGQADTSDPTVIAFRDSERSVFVSRTDGVVLDSADPRFDQLVLGCGSPGGWGFVTLDTWDGERDDYVRGAGPLRLCDLDGRPVAVPDLLQNVGHAPGWFGPSHFPEDDVRPVPPEERIGADRWVLWADGDGTLHGARPPDG
jgi:hypothetical protein